MQENMYQQNSKYQHFLRSAILGHFDTILAAKLCDYNKIRSDKMTATVNVLKHCIIT